MTVGIRRHPPVHRGRLAFAASITVAMATAGCGSSAAPSGQSVNSGRQASAAYVSPPARAGRPAARVLVRTRKSPYGTMLVDGTGRTLYLFTHDLPGHSRCEGACAEAWPPYVVPRVGGVGGQARANLIALVTRPHHEHQVSYAGHPLYYYVGDRRPGDILCQDVEEYGGHWWVVSAAGRALTRSGPPCGSSRMP